MNQKISYSIHTSNDITNIGTVEIEFAIFCIENVAEKLKMPGEEAYDLIAKKKTRYSVWIYNTKL